MNTNARIISIAAIFLIALVALPAMAYETPPPCPPGEVWGQTGENCYQVPAVYGPCQNCPSHQEQVCVETCNHDYCKNHGQSCSQHDYQHHQNDCKYQRGECLDYDTQTVYDCNYNENFIKDQCSNHKGKPLLTPAHQQCDPIFGCIAVSCPAIPCDSGYTCQDNQCVPDGSCPATPCDEGYSCVEGQCVQNPAPVCGVDFFCDEGYHCSDNVCVQNPPEGCPTVLCEGGQECVDGVCVTPTSPSGCGDGPACTEGGICVDGQCMAPTPVVLAAAGADLEGHVDGVGFVLWDRLITPTGRDEGYYWHTFNETAAWIQINGPGAFNVAYTQVQSEYTRSAHGSGSYPADTPGQWTIILLGTNAIDNPTEPRVLAACKINVESLSLDEFGSLHAIVERTRNYIEE